MADAMDATPAPSDHALELRRVMKSFGPVVALRSGSLVLDRGSIHALIGENGAGKSTLVKIIAGLYRRDDGDFLLVGESVDFASTAQSKAAGIAATLDAAARWKDVDITRVVLAAWSVGGVSTAAIASRDARVKGLLSLDAALGYDYGPRLLGALEVSDVVKPILHITGALPNSHPVPKSDEMFGRIGAPAWVATVAEKAGTQRRGEVIGAVQTSEGIGVFLGVLIGPKLYHHYIEGPVIASATLLTIGMLLSFLTVRGKAAPGSRLPAPSEGGGQPLCARAPVCRC